MNTLKNYVSQKNLKSARRKDKASKLTRWRRGIGRLRASSAEVNLSTKGQSCTLQKTLQLDLRQGCDIKPRTALAFSGTSDFAGLGRFTDF